MSRKSITRKRENRKLRKNPAYGGFAAHWAAEIADGLAKTAGQRALLQSIPDATLSELTILTALLPSLLGIIRRVDLPLVEISADGIVVRAGDRQRQPEKTEPSTPEAKPN